MTTELEREQATLVVADRDIAQGRARIERQRTLVESGRLAGAGADEAERLLSTLESCLAEWERHRALILERIAYLSRPDSAGP